MCSSFSRFVWFSLILFAKALLDLSSLSLNRVHSYYIANLEDYPSSLPLEVSLETLSRLRSDSETIWVQFEIQKEFLTFPQSKVLILSFDWKIKINGRRDKIRGKESHEKNCRRTRRQNNRLIRYKVDQNNEQNHTFEKSPLPYHQAR